MIAYKLLSQEMTSNGGVMKWELNKINKATGPGNKMCTDGVLHCYSHPMLAVLFNSIHANIENPRLFEIECGEIVANDGLKQGSKYQTPTKELIIPSLTGENRVEFSIRCALGVCSSKTFQRWAYNWLSGQDRSPYSAREAVDMVEGFWGAEVDAARYACYAALWVHVPKSSMFYAARAASYANDKCLKDKFPPYGGRCGVVSQALIALQSCSFYK